MTDVSGDSVRQSQHAQTLTLSLTLTLNPNPVTFRTSGLSPVRVWPAEQKSLQSDGAEVMLDGSSL